MNVMAKAPGASPPSTHKNVRVSRPAPFGSGFLLYEYRDGQPLRVGSADSKDQVIDFILHRGAIPGGIR